MMLIVATDMEQDGMRDRTGNRTDGLGFVSCPYLIAFWDKKKGGMNICEKQKIHLTLSTKYDNN